jgi:ubiquinone/menaquinone biosynthesis C-methylase UbiE
MSLSHSLLEANLAEYSDAELYDLENPDSEQMNAFLLSLAQEIGEEVYGPVLELGCGTGRFTIALARQGLELIGLDVVPGMLACAAQKAQGLPLQWPIQWVEADARTFQLDRQVSLIFDVGEAFLHVLDREDHEAILARVREHLLPNGRFMLATAFLRLEMLTTREEHDWFSYVGPQGQEVRVSGTTRYDPVAQIYHEDAIRRWQEANGQEVVRYAPLARRRFFPEELKTLLHYNGFKILACYGDWDRSEFSEKSPTIILVCQPIS